MKVSMIMFILGLFFGLTVIIGVVLSAEIHALGKVVLILWPSCLVCALTLVILDGWDFY